VVWPIWLKMVRWEAPLVMAGFGFISMVEGQSSKLELGRAPNKSRVRPIANAHTGEDMYTKT
jgi:hypothetical protein